MITPRSNNRIYRTNSSAPLLLVDGERLLDKVVEILLAPDDKFAGEISDELFAHFSKDKQSAGDCIRSATRVTRQHAIERIEKLRKAK